MRKSTRLARAAEAAARRRAASAAPADGPSPAPARTRPATARRPAAARRHVRTGGRDGPQRSAGRVLSRDGGDDRRGPAHGAALSRQRCRHSCRCAKDWKRRSKSWRRGCACCNAGVERRRHENATIAQLAELLTALDAGKPVALEAFAALGDEILTDALEGGPLRFLDGDATRPAHFVACHSLTVARVVARVVRHDPELKSRPLDAVLAALLHDAGMVQTPAAILTHAGPLNDEQRRAIEAHCRIGAGLAAKLAPDATWLADAARAHHERLDGTGYPGGLRESQISSLARLIAVCDVYAALCASRPHRPARETRTALADTLLLADQGLLDRHQAERLLQLSFYPAGSIVEMANGAIGRRRGRADDAA